MKRPWIAPVALIAAVVLAVGVWMALDAPRDDTTPTGGRSRPPVTAAVERRALESSIVVRASVAAADQVSVVAPGRPEGQTASVVTAAPPATGSPVHAGRSVIEINGRPVVLLAMSIPLYRDIVPGVEGPDVVSLQTELTRLGFDVSSDAPGRFEPATQAAVGALFDQAGYEPGFVAGSRAAFDAGLASAEQRADEALTAANRSRASGVADPELDAAVRTARAEVKTFEESQGVELRSSETARMPKADAVIVGTVPAGGDIVEPGSAVLTLAAPQPVVTVALTRAQVPQVTPKSAISVTGGGSRTTCRPGPLVPPPTPVAAGEGPDGDGPSTVSGASGGEAQPQDDAGAGEVTLELSCDAEFALGDIGGSFTATVTTKVALERLVVPATAVASTASGSASVDRAVGSGRFEHVPIEVRAEAGGFVSIDVPQGGLRAGDRVRVRRS